MKILFLNEYAPPHSVSGAEHSMMALYLALKKIGIKVFLLSPHLGGQKQDLKFPFPKKILPGQILSPLWFNNPFFWLYSALWIYRAIHRRKIDLLHVHGKYILPGAVLAGWLARKPVVTTVRDFKFLCPLSLCFTHRRKTCGISFYINKEIAEYWQRYAKTAKWKLVFAKLWQYKLKWFLNRCQQVIAVSPQLAKIYQDNGVKKVTSIYNLPPSAKDHSAPGIDKHVILSVGKLSYGKGTDCLVRAAGRLPQYQFVFCGEINPSFKLDFPSNCRYLGKINHSQTLKLYSKASLFALLSRWPEPLSRAGLEALSYGLPIVASNRGGNHELVKDNGLLVNPDKSEEIVKAIKKIFSQDLKKLSQNSLKLSATRFNHQKIIQKHQKLYQSLL